MYKNAQLLPWLEEQISATLKEESQRIIGSLKCVCVSVTSSQSNCTLMGDSGAAPETAAPSTKHQIMEFLVEEWCCSPPDRVPDTIYATVH